MRTTRKNLYEINYWPGFVDVLGTLLIVTIFTVLISTITQIYFNDQLEVKRGEISNLDDEIKNLLASKFNREIISQLLKINTFDIEEILRNCNYSDSFIKNANDLQILEAISDCYQEYRVLKL